MGTRELLTRLESAQPVITKRLQYYRGESPLRFTVDRVDGRMAFRSNLARVAVQSVSERIRLEGVKAFVGDRDVSSETWKAIQDAELPMLLQGVITEMLAAGSAYLIVWVDEFGRPVVTGETPEQVAVERDPVTRAVTEAVKRWQVFDGNGVVTEEHVMKYQRTRIVHMKRDMSNGKLKFVRRVDNPLGVVPVVPLINVDRIHDDVGTSIIDDLAPLIDALNKVLTDMLTTSESVARPRRWATGVNLEDREEASEFTADGIGLPHSEIDSHQTDGDGLPKVQADENQGVESPFKDSDDLWVAEQPEAKFGQLPGADLASYETAVNVLTRQISAISSLPAHMLGVSASLPATAESLRVSEMNLARNADGRIRVVTAPLEWAIRIMVAIKEGISPDLVTVKLTWADTRTRAIAQEADAAVKLHGEQIISDSEARSMVGHYEEV